LSIFGLSVAAAIAEYRIYNTDFFDGNPDDNPNNGNALFGGNLSIYYYYNSGIYAISAAFGFFVTILYSFHMFYCFKSMINSKCYTISANLY
jgi:hypothetical protein